MDAQKYEERLGKRWTLFFSVHYHEERMWSPMLIFVNKALGRAGFVVTCHQDT